MRGDKKGNGHIRPTSTKMLQVKEKHFGHRVEAAGSQYPETSISPTEEGHALSSAACSLLQGELPFPSSSPVWVNTTARGTGEGMLAQAVHRVQSCPAG